MKMRGKEGRRERKRRKGKREGRRGKGSRPSDSTTARQQIYFICVSILHFIRFSLNKMLNYTHNLFAGRQRFSLPPLYRSLPASLLLVFVLASSIICRFFLPRNWVPLLPHTRTHTHTQGQSKRITIKMPKMRAKRLKLATK